MIEFLLCLVWATVKLCGYTLLAYLVYYKVIDYAHCVWFYGRQGKDIVLLIPGHLPFIGHAIPILKSVLKSWRLGDNKFLMQHFWDDAIADDSFATEVFFVTNGAGLIISDPVVIGELYTSKNKYFDKHPLIKECSMCLTGESILFIETTKDWKESRKAMSPAFYKGKLENLVEIAKTAVRTTVNRFDSIIDKSGDNAATADIIAEVNMM